MHVLLARYWRDGKCLGGSGDCEDSDQLRILKFLGSQTFGAVADARPCLLDGGSDITRDVEAAAAPISDKTLKS